MKKKTKKRRRKKTKDKKGDTMTQHPLFAKNRFAADIFSDMKESSFFKRVMLKLIEQIEQDWFLSMGAIRRMTSVSAGRPCLLSLLGTTEDSYRECRVHKGQSTEKHRMSKTTQYWAADVAVCAYMSKLALGAKYPSPLNLTMHYRGHFIQD